VVFVVVVVAQNTCPGTKTLHAACAVGAFIVAPASMPLANAVLARRSDLGLKSLMSVCFAVVKPLVAGSMWAPP
jgi:hypothetical protein